MRLRFKVYAHHLRDLVPQSRASMGQLWLIASHGDPQISTITPIIYSPWRLNFIWFNSDWAMKGNQDSFPGQLPPSIWDRPSWTEQLSWIARCPEIRKDINMTIQLWLSLYVLITQVTKQYGHSRHDMGLLNHQLHVRSHHIACLLLEPERARF